MLFLGHEKSKMPLLKKKKNIPHSSQLAWPTDWNGVWFLESHTNHSNNKKTLQPPSSGLKRTKFVW
jgi:hypothetical protein